MAGKGQRPHQVSGPGQLFRGPRGKSKFRGFGSRSSIFLGEHGEHGEHVLKKTSITMANFDVFARFLSPIFADWAIAQFLARVENPIWTCGKVWKQQILASVKPEEEETEDGEEMGDALFLFVFWMSHFPLLKDFGSWVSGWISKSPNLQISSVSEPFNW